MEDVLPYDWKGFQEVSLGPGIQLDAIVPVRQVCEALDQSPKERM